jgi:hypothetical protein
LANFSGGLSEIVTRLIGFFVKEMVFVLGDGIENVSVSKFDINPDGVHRTPIAIEKGIMKSRIFVPLLTVAALFLTTSTAGASISVKAAGNQYLKDVAPANIALGKFGKEASKWTSQTTDAQAEKEASPSITALRQLQNALLAQSWPTKAKGDVRTLIKIISPLEADLVSLGGLTVLGISSWESKFASDATNLGLDVNYVRHDLGLPLNS